MFLLDANVFMEASRTYYSPDLAPSFWGWLAEQHLAGHIASISKVRREILDGEEGHLTEWSKILPHSFWLSSDLIPEESLRELAAWTMHPDRAYWQAARSEFLDKADYYLVAQARGGGHVVVTREQPRPTAKKRILIPDACAAMSVGCIDPFDLYRQLGLSL